MSKKKTNPVVLPAPLVIPDVIPATPTADPDGMNEERIKWAGIALAAFAEDTRCDAEFALPDLLADLMHWALRNGQDFEMALRNARGNFVEETYAGK